MNRFRDAGDIPCDTEKRDGTQSARDERLPIESALWRARQQRLSGSAILSTSAEGYADVASREKSLAAWTAELHQRRRTIASDASNAVHASLRDPFPATYSFTFRKDLTPGAVETIHFVNPAARCTFGTSAYGTITITGM